MNNYTLTSQNSQPIATMKNTHSVVGFRVSTSSNSASLQQFSGLGIARGASDLVYRETDEPHNKIKYLEGRKDKAKYHLNDKIAKTLKWTTNRKGEKTVSSIALCGRAVVPVKESVDILFNGSSSRYRNLRTCKNAHVCPFCSQLRAVKESEQLERELNFLRSKGYHGYLLTFTLSHKITDSLEDVFGALNGAAKSLFRNNSFKRFMSENNLMLARVTAREITYSENNGWHPHLHIIMLSEQEFTTHELLEIRKKIYKFWLHELSKYGKKCNENNGVTFVGGNNAAKYISKWGLHAELSLSHKKNGKNGSMNFFDIANLHDEENENDKYTKLVKEYHAVTKNTAPLNRSKNWVKLLEELGYKEAEEKEIEEKLLISFSKTEWRVIAKLKFRGGALDIATQCAKFANCESYIIEEIYRDFSDLELEQAVVLASSYYQEWKYKYREMDGSRLPEDLVYHFALGDVLDYVERNKFGSIREMLLSRQYSYR